MSLFASTFFISTLLAAPTLTLKDAILLAVRDNPNVETSELNHTLQKYNLYVQHWAFAPHYALEASANAMHGTMPGQQNFNVQPSVMWQTHLGTSFALDFSNLKSTHYNPGLSLNIMQPLLRGFNKDVIDAALNNAKDDEYIARLNIEDTLRHTVTAVINAYLDVIYAMQIVKIDREAVKRAQVSVVQTKLFIKAGDKAGDELVTVIANVSSAESQLENDQNTLSQARFALLDAIGLDPNSALQFAPLSFSDLMQHYHAPTLAETKQLILMHDIQYQVDQITLHGETTRAILMAEDNARWQLNLTANLSTGNASGGGRDAGINSLINNVNQSQNVGLTLQIPIDDHFEKQAVLSAKVALKEAEIALNEEKWRKETEAMNGWYAVESSEKALRFAASAKTWQVKTYQVSYQKYLHGLIDSLELQSAALSLTQAEQTLLTSNINDVKAWVNLDLLTGHTLHTWDITVRTA